MINSSLKIFLLCLFGLWCFSLFCCEEEAPRIRAPERKLIDSLYKQQTELLKVELDSICSTSRKARIDFAVDSIMDLRLKERKERLGY